MPSSARLAAGGTSNGSGKPLPRTWIRSAGTTPAASDVVALDARRRHDRRRARRDAAVERRVERPLERHLPQPRPEHAERLEDVRDAAQPRPAGGDRRHRVAEAEDVHDVRPLGALELDRQRRRDPHPAVAGGRREVVHAHAVLLSRPASARRRAGRATRGSSSAPRPSARARRAVRSARAPTTTGPPNAVAGHHAGAANRMRRPVCHARKLALAPCPRPPRSRVSSSSTSTTGRASRRPRSSSPTSARRSPTSTTSAC